MRAATERTRDTLNRGGVTARWMFDLMYDGERRMSNVPIAIGPGMTWDGSRFVAAAGTARVVWSDANARSGIPRDVGDWFAPFGAELQVDCIVGVGVFSERVPQGRFVITDIPDAVESTMLWEGRLIHPNEAFTVALKDRLVKAQRDPFPYPMAPRSTSAWEEVQALTGLPLIRNAPDKLIPQTAYEGSREDAVKAIFDTLDAWPHLDSAGALTSRPKAWPAVAGTFGPVISKTSVLTSEDTYNRVAVTGKSPDGEPLYGVREVRSGFLRTRNVDGSPSPFGGATYPYKNTNLTTQAEVDEYANGLLPRVARVRSRTVTVTVPFNPLWEIGDVATFADTATHGAELMRIRTITHDGGTTRCNVEVADA